MRFSTGIAAVAAVLLVSTSAQAFPNFLGRVPGTPNSCGVCHVSPGGGGPRNAFGEDMDDNGFDWAVVCGLDSDADGQINGQELGDPQCVWTQGATRARTGDLSNPGDANSKSANPDGVDGAVEEDAGVVEPENDAGAGDADAGAGDADAGDGGETPASCNSAGNGSSVAGLFGTLVALGAVARRRRR